MRKHFQCGADVVGVYLEKEMIPTRAGVSINTGPRVRCSPILPESII